MGYEAALNKAWDTLKGLSGQDRFSVSLLDESYTADLKSRIILSSSGVPAKEYVAVLLLHYLIGTMKKSFTPSGIFVSFKDIEGGEFYYSAFRKNAIIPIIKKFGKNPETLYSVLGRIKGNRINAGDFAIEIRAFDNVLVRIILWKGDEEFAPEATILFDSNLANIYSTEDMAVFLRVIAYNL